MCGIAGLIDKTQSLTSDNITTIVTKMKQAISHRGPDANGSWIEPQHHIGFAHTRLSIVDLSEAGAQPMLSSNKRCMITYNGEVYNSEELKQDLLNEGISFKGHSDTEVILEACARWGIESTVSRLIGMFAFAFYDLNTSNLTIVRDRLGIKPLYWADLPTAFVFGSELTALECHHDFAIDVSKPALSSYLRKGCVSGKQSIASHCYRLEPGTMLSRDAQGEVSITRYWHGNEFNACPSAATNANQPEHHIDQLESLLTDAISIRTIADVPLGAFLSGGIDSTTVVALMQKVSSTPVNTFSIGFSEAKYDESSHAAATADYLGTAHTQLMVTAQDTLEAIPLLPEIYDEPFADPSQIPTYLLSKLTRQHVTVALSGDGGDELFAGYSRYFNTLNREESLLRIPGAMRYALGKSMQLAPGSLCRAASPYVSEKFRKYLSGDRLPALADILIKYNREKLYQLATSYYNQPELLITDYDAEAVKAENEIDDFLRYMQCDDLNNYLPDDILTKLDRASMFVGLEARVPIIDHRIVEFASRLPTDLKYRDGEGKWILKQVLYKHVPKELVDRPKKGFGVPIGQWLRKELLDWADDLLNDQTIRDMKLLNYKLLDHKWSQHRQSIANWENHLWDILMLHGWLRHRLNCGRL